MPIVAAVIIGFVLSLINLIQGNEDFYFDSLSILILLLLASRYFLSRTQQTFINSSYMQTFIDSQVCQRWNSESKEYDKIPARHLNVDDKVLIKEGERVPADGIVLNEWVNINPSILTGESPSSKTIQGFCHLCRYSGCYRLCKDPGKTDYQQQSNRTDTQKG